MKKELKINKLKNLRKLFPNKKIGLCHGAFDILHYGHLNHLREAKNKVDILIVSLTADKFIKKGPMQPYNNETKRLKLVEHIDIVNYVYLDKNECAEEVISNLKPHFYFKGKDYLDKDITENLSKEIKVLRKNGGKFIITKTELMSSTKIINNKLSFFSKKQKLDIKNLQKLNAFDNILNAIEYCKNLEVDVIGDPIIDSYVNCRLVGLTTKDPTISTVAEKKYNFAGGVLAVSMMLSKFVKKVNLITYGNKQKLKHFFKNYKNVAVKSFDEKLEIQNKTKYINNNRYEKLLQVSNFQSHYWSRSHSNIIKKLLSSKNLIICDYGLGIFSSQTLKFLNNLKLKKFINVQSNSLNYGNNLFTKYNNCTYMSLDKREWELGLQMNIEKIKFKDIKKNFLGSPTFAITEGKNGSSLVFENKKISSSTFINKTIDTVGCGDAFFAITSLLLISKLQKEIIPFAGNAYAGMHGQYLGNSEIINKTELLKYLKSLLNF